MTGRILGNNGILLTSSQEFKEQLANNLFRLISVGRAPITSRSVTSPPGNPSPDSYYIVPSGATGAWANRTNQIAYPVLGATGQPVSGSWAFWVPFTGLKVTLINGAELIFDGTQWEDFAGNIDTGITDGDKGDITVTSSGTVWTIDDDAITTGKIADNSVTYSKIQTISTSNRLLGRSSGGSGNVEEVSIGGGLTLSGGILTAPVARETLTSNRTYFVRTDGNDGNTGLANSSGGAFLTIQKAIDTVASLDISIYDVTIQVTGNFTVTSPVRLKPIIGSGRTTILGNDLNPASVTLTGTNSDIFIGQNPCGNWLISGFRVTTTTSGCAFASIDNCLYFIRNINFASCATFQVILDRGGAITVEGSGYTISGGTPQSHVLCQFDSRYSCQAKTITLTSTPSFSNTFGFVYSIWNGVVDFVDCTFTGTATGRQYLAEKGGYIRGSVNGQLPGNSAGSVVTPGFYST